MKTLAELQLDLAELDVEHSRLSGIKVAYQAQAAELNAKCATHLPQKIFSLIQQERAQVVKELNNTEALLADNKQQKRVLWAAIDVAKAQNKISAIDVRSLVGIRDRWHDFSMDSEQHQKAREVAWKISQELGSVLKAYFQSKET